MYSGTLQIPANYATCAQIGYTSGSLDSIVLQ